MVVNDNMGEIVSCEQCLDSAASAGRCKRNVVFLMWTHWRSEEVMRSSVTGKKSTLARVGINLKFVTLEHVCEKSIQ